MLSGPEPDRLWEGFTASVLHLVERLGVGLVVGFHGIPMASRTPARSAPPRTRPGPS